MTDPILPLRVKLSQPGAAAQPARRPLRRSSNLLSLEQRFMFDGAVVDAAHHAVADAAAAAALVAVPAAVEVRAADPARDNGKKEVVIVDTSLFDYKTLEAGLRDGVGIVEFDGTKDGLAQIAQWAASQSGLDAIHILSHGSAGLIELGSARLTAASVTGGAIQSELAGLGQALAPSGDLLFYGCDAAAGANGAALLDGIARATGADVAASLDATGAASRGGDWTLEAHVGKVDAAAVEVDRYQGLLGTMSFVDDTDAGMYSDTVTKQDPESGLQFTFTTPSTDSVYWDPSGGIGAGLGVLTMNAPANYAFDLIGIKATLWGGGPFTMSWTNADTTTGSHVYAAGDGFDPVAGFTGLFGVTQVVFTSNDAAVFGDFVVSHLASTLNQPPSPDAAPAISGTAKVGSTLHGGNGTWSDPESDVLTYSYQWYRADDASGASKTAIVGANTSSYALTTADAHKYLSMQVTADDGHGNAPTASSAWTQVTNSGPSNSVRPSASGTFAVGNTLTAQNGTWADADGDATTYTYQWFSALDATGTGSTAIGGAIGNTYTLTAADAHKYVTLQVTANDGHGGTSTTSGDWTAVADTAPSNTALPTITGSASVGAILGSTNGSWSDVDGDAMTYSYQWYRASDSSGTGSSAIAGATTANYTVTGADAHEFVQLRVTANDGHGRTTSAFSAWTGVADSAPANSAAPTITGATTVGSTVTAAPGTWSDADGDTITYNYQWFRADDSSGTNAAAIGGANTAGYTLTSSDTGKFVSVKVTANDGHGSAPQASSSWSQVQDIPSVTSIVRSGGAPSLVSASDDFVQYTVTFSQAVTGVDASDFALTATGTASGDIASVVGSGSTYTVTVANISGDGTMRLDLNGAGTGIQSAASVPIAAGYSAGQAYTFDHTAPGKPSAPDLDAGTDSGISNSDNVTSNQTPSFTGGAEDGSKVTVYVDGVAQATTTAIGGSWSFNPVTPLADGAHVITATATDSAGNVSQFSDGLSFSIDHTPSTAISVDVPPAGMYKEGDLLTFTVHTSEAVFINSGAPTLPIFLDAGGGLRAAQYVSGSGTTALQFTYRVQAGDLDVNGIDVGNVNVSGASLTDAAGNAFDGMLGFAVATPGVYVDAVAPAVNSVDVPAAGTYYIGQNLDLSVNFSEAVLVDTGSGTPRISITLDNGGTVYADYLSGSGSGTLVFRHTVAAGEIDGTGITVGSMSLQGATIRDAASNDADTTLNSVASTSLVNVDGSVPQVLSVGAFDADGAYKAGTTITIYVNMDRDVAVDTSGGVPTLALSSGGTAVFSGGSGGTTLSFTYMVGDGENSPDLDYTSAAALALNGATIKDAGGGHADADVTLPAPGAAQSLGAAKDIVIDTIAPTNGATDVAFSNDTGTSATDLVTNAPAQTITGALSEPLASGETVKVSLDNGATWHTAVAATGSTTFTLAGQTLTGGGTLLVKVSDAAGNDGAAYSRDYALDTVAPSIAVGSITLSADTGSSSTDFVTDTASQTISATLSAAPAGTDIVYGSVDGGATWTDITGKVSGTTIAWDGVTLADGAHAIQFKVTDAAGNDGAVASQAYTLDTGAPATAVASASFSSDTGVSASDFVTASALQTISGALSADIAAGETVFVSLDDGNTWTAASASGSTWTLAGQTLAGSGTLKVKVSDTAGNDSTAWSQAYVLDIVTPPVTFANLSLSNDTGSSSADFITSSAAQTIGATLSTGLSTGDIVYGSLDGGATWTDITAKVAGTTLAWDGVTLAASGTIKLRVIDAAGNEGAELAQAYTLDTAAPGLAFSNVHISADTGYLSTDFITNAASQTITATLSGPLAAGDIVYGSLDGGATWTDITAKVSGTTLTWDGATLSAGAIKLKVSDAAGNEGAVTSQGYTLDTAAPAPRVIVAGFSNDTFPPGPNLITSADFITSASAQDIHGLLSADLATGETVYVSLNNGATWTAAIAGRAQPGPDGLGGQAWWSLTGQTLTGSGTLKVKVTDSAGNDGAVYSRAYVLDTTPPAGIGAIALSADTGASAHDFVTSIAAQDISGTLSAALAAGETVYVSLDDGATWQPATAAVGQDTWALPGQTLAASGTLKVKVIDAAGNEGPVASRDYVLDTSAPAAPVVDAVTAAGTAPVLSGSASLQEGETLSVSVGGATYAVVPAAGHWTLDLGSAAPAAGKLSLANGNTYEVTATVTDKAGNATTDATRGELVIAGAPVTVVTGLSLSADTGTSATDFITKTATQTVTGTLSANLAADEIVEVSTDGGATWTRATAAAGSDRWSVNVTLNGSSTLEARVTNAHGSSASLAHAYVLDTTAPGATVTGTAQGGGAITGTLSAALGAGESVLVSTDHGATWTAATLDATRTGWSVSGSAAGLVQVKLVDTAGNESATQDINLAPPPVPHPPVIPMPAPIAPVSPVAESAPPAAPVVQFLPPSSPLGAPTAAARPEAVLPTTSVDTTPPSAQPLTHAAVAGGFRAMVIPATAGAADALVANNPVHDLAIGIGGKVNLQLAADAFAHTNPDATVSLAAVLVDGSALPAWLNFDPRTGQFSGTPPAGFSGTITVRVIARDSQGHEAAQVFRIVVGKDAAKGGQPPAPRDAVNGRHEAVGRASLSQQLRGARGGGSERLAALSHSAKVAAKRA